MAAYVFAFGTLKKGFPLHRQALSGARFLGPHQTRERYPMLIAGPWFAPMMFDEPGTGYQVRGELFEADDELLAALDQIESVGTPGNFRSVIEVEPIGGKTALSAFVYMKTRDLAVPVHSGYLEFYEDRRFIPFDRRPGITGKG